MRLDILWSKSPKLQLRESIESIYDMLGSKRILQNLLVGSFVQPRHKEGWNETDYFLSKARWHMTAPEITKQRFPLAAAQDVARDLVRNLSGACRRIKIAGSVRRGKPDVGDIEILAIPVMGMTDSGDLFGTPRPFSKLDLRLQNLVNKGILEYRKTKIGTVVNGEKIKLFRDLASGIPVDVFVTNEASWWNYLVCRTGPKKLNTMIAMRAKKMGLKWEPYSSGFLVPETGQRIICRSEREVFETVDLPYWNPEGPK